MKSRINLAVVRFLSAVLCGTAITALAAVPVRWTAETSRVQPIALDAWRGDTLALECTLKSYGRPVALGAATASIMWQTNGMGSAWWQTNATVSSDGVIRATWSPSMDPGAQVVAFFLPVQTGDGASYRAAGTLRFRQSPGAGSQIAELPQPGGTLDFGEFNLVNAPWATLEAANEAISAAVTSATGALVIPPAVDLTPYATTVALQTASTSLSNDIQLAFNASSNYTDQVSATLSATISSSTNSLGSVLRDTIAESAAASRTYADSAASNAQANAEAAASNYTDQVSATLSSTISSSTNSLGSVLRDTIAESAAASRTYADGVASNAQAYADGVASNAQRAAIAAIPSLSGYATEQYVSDAISSIDIPSMSGYATMAYADAVASNAQRSAIAAIPSLSGYATEQYVSDYFATSYTPPDLSSYASRSYADAAASNAQAAAISAIPSLAGYATETYAQNAAADAASDALSAAQSYARDLSWGASEGNTRLVSLDGTIWQDATGTVWQVSYVYGWSGTVIDLQTAVASPIKFVYAGKTEEAPDDIGVPTNYWTAGGGTNFCFGTVMGGGWYMWFTNSYHGESPDSRWAASGDPAPWISATNLTFNTDFEQYSLFYQPVALATNPVDHVLYASASGDAATADRALSIGTPTRWTDATGCVWQVDFVFQQVIFILGDPYELSYSAIPNQISWYDSEFLYRVYYDTLNHEWEYSTSGGSWTNTQEIVLGQQTITLYDELGNADPISFDLTYDPTTNLITRVAYTNDLPDTASITNDLANLRTESAIVYRLYSGSNVIAEVTNFNSQVHAPSLRLLQLNESNEYITVWTETNGLARTLAAATNYTDRAIADYAAPRAWSRTTSGLGADAPANTTWISTPTTVIAGGLEYAKFVDTYGEVWVLTSNGMAAEFNPDTNAYFRITADDGTPIFSVEKSDAKLVGANAAGITVGESTITIPVPVVSSTAPTMYWRSSLSSGDWADESAVNPNYMSVGWTGGPGSWVCTISFDGTRPPSMFFKFNFLQEGGVVIRNNATTDLSSGIYVNGTKFVPTVSGNNLIWTKQ